MKITPEGLRVASKAMRRFAKVLEQLNATVLAGWPHDFPPSEEQARAIASTRGELLLHEPDLGNDRAWYLAGQIVARIARDHAMDADRD